MTDVFGATPEDLQKKVYFLLEQLQSMARELPPKYQQRIPCELLSGLANCLLNDTVFEIVKGLMEIQHVTEKHLFQQRLQIINRQKMEMQDVFHHTTEEDIRKKQHALLQLKHTEELKQTDMKLVLQLDQKLHGCRLYPSFLCDVQFFMNKRRDEEYCSASAQPSLSCSVLKFSQKQSCNCSLRKIFEIF